MNLLFKFPTRGRPEQFKGIVNGLLANFSGKHDCHFVFTVDADDTSMHTPDMKKYFESLPGPKVRSTIQVTDGNVRKIEACNYGLFENGKLAFDFDVLLLWSDDMTPAEPRLDNRVAIDMKLLFSDLDGCLQYHDGTPYVQDPVSLPILGRKFIETVGHVYHPAYKCCFCDQELADVAMKRGKLAKLLNVTLVKHDNSSRDDTWKRNEYLYEADKTTYFSRKAAGFPRASPYSVQ